MREILFRGKTKEKGEWVQGYFVYAKSDFDSEELREADIIPHNTDRVYKGEYNVVFTCIPDSIGHYTGLTDKNGNKIFEGDIVKILYPDWISLPLEDTRSLEEYLDSLTEKGVVDFAPYVGWYLKNGKYDLSIISGTHGYIEVIGNIHDNPELLRTPQNDEVRE